MLLQYARSALNRHIAIRCCSDAFPKPRRFYKEVKVNQLKNDLYEVQLDSRALRTPKKKKLHVDSYPLALAIAHEWDTQGETIDVPQMRLTGFQFTVIDNPTNETRDTLVEKIMEYIDTDTLLYFNDSPRELCELEDQKWLPIVDWANRSHKLALRPTYTLVDMPTIPDDSRCKLQQYFLRMQFAELTAINYGVDAIKSVLLMLACLHNHLDTQTASELSNLEQRYQTKVYKKIKGVHDLQECDVNNRLTAAVLFALLTSGVK